MFQFSLTLCSKRKGYKFLFMHLFVVRTDSYLGDHEVHPQQSFLIQSKIFLSLTSLFCGIQMVHMLTWNLAHECSRIRNVYQKKKDTVEEEVCLYTSPQPGFPWLSWKRQRQVCGNLGWAWKTRYRRKVQGPSQGNDHFLLFFNV